MTPVTKHGGGFEQRNEACSVDNPSQQLKTPDGDEDWPHGNKCTRCGKHMYEEGSCLTVEMLLTPQEQRHALTAPRLYSAQE